ncbi:conserved hypothetical protein [Sulfurovum sp. enrichment culture clone C5]|uniref:Ribbon-helix-helix protein CopG domain-containing protein n=1 Tax=Sulfurovum sp. enrichment culture clone C5 TaxID=497650 RepID=A0A0S4XNW9_9BACT|nr:conserved hypothetical protein [Sulfurovum sp. enrichment culture clone C5]
MQRLNLTIDENLYEQARAFSFLQKKSISQIIRESLEEYMNSDITTKQKADLLLEADDKEEILKILKKDEFVSHQDFKAKFNL